MEGTKAPRFIFDPRPTPRINPGPVAKTVGNPAGREASGIPGRSVLCDLFPTTVVIEVIVASDAAAYVFAGGRGRQSRVTLLAPAIEVVERGHRYGGNLYRTLAREFDGFPGLQRLGDTFRGKFQPAAVDSHPTTV